MSVYLLCLFNCCQSKVKVSKHISNVGFCLFCVFKICFNTGNASGYIYKRFSTKNTSNMTPLFIHKTVTHLHLS